MIRVCEVAEVAPTAKKSLPHLKLELLDLLNKDPVTKLTRPDLLLTIDLLSFDKSPLSAIKRQCELAGTHLDDYKNRAVELLKKCFDNELQLSWLDIYELIQNFFAQLIHAGVSQEVIVRSLFECEADNSSACSARVLSALQNCICRSQHFTCWAVVNWPQSKGIDQPYRHADLIVQPNLPAIEQNDVRKFKDKIGNATGLIVSCELKARDEFSARDRFVALLGRMFSYVSLYRPKLLSLIQGSVVLVEHRDNRIYYCLNSAPSYSIPIQDARDLHGKVNRTLKSRSKLSYPDQRKIDAAFQYHSIALSAPVPEAQLVNLWISLESLIDSEQSSIIESIASYVSDLSALSYVENSVYDLARQIKRKPWMEEVSGILPIGATYQISCHDLLSVLCKQGGTGRWEILSTAAMHDKDIYSRMKFLADSVLGKPSNLRKRLSRERIRVDWQVRRIYRERNEIAHRGDASAILPYLLSHLFAYQSSVLRTIMRDLRTPNRSSGSTIEHCIQHRRTSWTTFSKSLESRSDSVTLGRLLDPANALADGPVIDIWQKTTVDPKK